MENWTDIAIAVPVVVLIAALLWRAAEALKRRGIVVRPVSDMDEVMTKVEKQFADKRPVKDVDVPPPGQGT